MSQTSVPDQSKSMSSGTFALTGNEFQAVDPVEHIDSFFGPERPDSDPEPSLEWKGPFAFARAHGAVPSIDHDFGSSWGSNGDQRVSLRLEVGANTGLLYVYDPTWDEYAVLGTFVQLVVVEHAVARARQFDDHLPVEKFQELAPDVGVGRVRRGPEL
ncbi:MAG: hypothetical protein ABIP19_10755 [Dermatophilaceae bacterium]